MDGLTVTVSAHRTCGGPLREEAYTSASMDREHRPGPVGSRKKSWQPTTNSAFLTTSISVSGTTGVEVAKPYCIINARNFAGWGAPCTGKDRDGSGVGLPSAHLAPSYALYTTPLVSEEELVYGRPAGRDVPWRRGGANIRMFRSPKAFLHRCSDLRFLTDAVASPHPLRHLPQLFTSGGRSGFSSFGAAWSHICAGLIVPQGVLWA